MTSLSQVDASSLRSNIARNHVPAPAAHLQPRRAIILSFTEAILLLLLQLMLLHARVRWRSDGAKYLQEYRLQRRNAADVAMCQDVRYASV